MELIFGALKKKLDRLKGSIFCADMLMDMEIPYLWQRLTAGIKGVYSAPEEWHKAFDKLTLSDVHEVMFRNEFIDQVDCLYEGFADYYDRLLHMEDYMEEEEPDHDEWLYEMNQYDAEVAMHNSRIGVAKYMEHQQYEGKQWDYRAIKDHLLANHLDLMKAAYDEACEVLDEVKVEGQELLGSLLAGFRCFVAEHHKCLYNKVMNDTKTFRMKRSNKMTVDDWERFCEAEEVICERAYREELVDDEEMEYISDEEKVLLEMHRELLHCITESEVDGEVFNFKVCIDSQHLLDHLLESNLDFFYERVHRRNLIQVGMNPDMQADYDHFLETWHREEKEEEKVEAKQEASVAEELPKEEEQGPEEVESQGVKIPAVLATPKAMEIWQKLIKAGMIDEEYQPTMSIRKASIIAYEMGNSLFLSPLWTPFETLWSAKDMCNSFFQAKSAKYYEEFNKKIVRAIKR